MGRVRRTGWGGGSPDGRPPSRPGIGWRHGHGRRGKGQGRSSGEPVIGISDATMELDPATWGLSLGDDHSVSLVAIQIRHARWLFCHQHKSLHRASHSITLHPVFVSSGESIWPNLWHLDNSPTRRATSAFGTCGPTVSGQSGVPGGDENPQLQRLWASMPRTTAEQVRGGNSLDLVGNLLALARPVTTRASCARLSTVPSLYRPIRQQKGWGGPGAWPVFRVSTPSMYGYCILCGRP